MTSARHFRIENLKAYLSTEIARHRRERDSYIATKDDHIEMLDLALELISGTGDRQDDATRRTLPPVPEDSLHPFAPLPLPFAPEDLHYRQQLSLPQSNHRGSATTRGTAPTASNSGATRRSNRRSAAQPPAAPSVQPQGRTRPARPRQSRPSRRPDGHPRPPWI